MVEWIGVFVGCLSGGGGLVVVIMSVVVFMVLDVGVFLLEFVFVSWCGCYLVVMLKLLVYVLSMCVCNGGLWSDVWFLVNY